MAPAAATAPDARPDDDVHHYAGIPGRGWFPVTAGAARAIRLCEVRDIDGVPVGRILLRRCRRRDLPPGVPPCRST